MDKKVFLEESDFYHLPKIEQVKYLCYYHLIVNEVDVFTIDEVEHWFEELSLPKPNKYRLLKNIRKSPDFVKGGTEKSLRLHGKVKSALDEEFKELQEPSNEITTFDTIIPKDLYLDTRGYIEQLAKQINASYENNIFDGCAVLMRRLTEILIIHTFKELNIEEEIKNGDSYIGMKYMIDLAIQNNTINLSQDSKKCIHTFRELGNFSAHKIYYNCKKQYITEVIPEFRILIEELLHKSRLI